MADAIKVALAEASNFKKREAKYKKRIGSAKIKISRMHHLLKIASIELAQSTVSRKRRLSETITRYLEGNIFDV